MEENIKMLEDFLEYNAFLKDANINDDIRLLWVYMAKNEFKAIEHLITRNRELEYKLREKINIEAHEQVQQLYIPKSKIKELKEKTYKLLDNNGFTRAYQLEIDRWFEELLEDNYNHIPRID